MGSGSLDFFPLLGLVMYMATYGISITGRDMNSSPHGYAVNILPNKLSLQTQECDFHVMMSGF